LSGDKEPCGQESALSITTILNHPALQIYRLLAWVIELDPIWATLAVLGEDLVDLDLKITGIFMLTGLTATITGVDVSIITLFSRIADFIAADLHPPIQAAPPRVLGISAALLIFTTTQGQQKQKHKTSQQGRHMISP